MVCIASSRSLQSIWVDAERGEALSCTSRYCKRYPRALPKDSDGRLVHPSAWRERHRDQLQKPASALGNGKGVVQSVYLDQYAFNLLVPRLAVKMIAAPACLGTGSPGGLFTPTLTVGALFGAVLGHIWAMALPASQPGAFAIIGSVAVLAAATQGPISSIAFLFELTHHAAPLTEPMLLAIVGVSLVTQSLDPAPSTRPVSFSACGPPRRSTSAGPLSTTTPRMRFPSARPSHPMPLCFAASFVKAIPCQVDPFGQH
jgi:hypothetical protein